MLPYAIGCGAFHSYGYLYFLLNLNRQKPYVTLKPGQKALERQYYEKSTRNEADGKGYFTNYKRFDSVYSDKHNNNVKPDNYKESNIAGNGLSIFFRINFYQIVGYDYSHEPNLLQTAGARKKRPNSTVPTLYFTHFDPHSDRPDFSKTSQSIAQPHVPVQAQTARQQLYKTTSHWQSNYAHFNGTALETSSRPAQRPEWTLPKTAYSSTRGYYVTEAEARFGKYGEKPRDVLPSDAEKIVTKKDENIIGTTKLTSHIPGYTGFIPISDANHVASQHGNCARPRTTFLKNNIIET